MAGKAEDAQNALKAAYVKAGRMKWFLGFEQSKDINVTLQIFADEACSRPLEFIEVNQYGESYGQVGKVVTKDGRTLTAEEAGARVTFYVKTEPHDLEPVFHAEAANPFKIEKAGQLAGGIWKYTVTAPDITGNTEYFDNFNTTYTSPSHMWKPVEVRRGNSASCRKNIMLSLFLTNSCISHCWYPITVFI